MRSFDNGHPQKILSFRATGSGVAAANIQPAEPPVKVILMVDEVNTDFRRVAYERDQIKKLLQENNGILAHPTSMAFFTDTGTEVQNTTLARWQRITGGVRPARDGSALNPA